MFLSQTFSHLDSLWGVTFTPREKQVQPHELQMEAEHSKKKKPFGILSPPNPILRGEQNSLLKNKKKGGIFFPV